MKKYQHKTYWTQWNTAKIRTIYFILNNMYDGIFQTKYYSGERNIVQCYKKNILMEYV
jgi:hypothetical protein